MRKLPFLLLIALCLCLCACSGEKAEPMDSNKEITIYYGDENCENLLSEKVTVNQLSPESIMAALLAKEVISEPVSVENFLMDKMGVIHLELGANFGEMIGRMGTSGEYIMLGSLVNSFLDAYDASALLLQVDGRHLETGHNIYDYPLEMYR